MSLCRTRFARDIVTEFLPPARKAPPRAMIFCAGMPGVPDKEDVMTFWSKRGWWCFFPRYRGTWESGGHFLSQSPEKDILDVAAALSGRPFRDVWSGRRFAVRPGRVVVVGTSFGGAAAILASKSRRIAAAVAVSPVVDWEAENRADPLEGLYRILREGYGEAYRMKRRDWLKLRNGGFYNPVRSLDGLNPRKILILHARDDRIVRAGPVIRFSRRLGCSFIDMKKGGHLSTSVITEPRYFRRISSFLRNNNG